MSLNGTLMLNFSVNTYFNSYTGGTMNYGRVDPISRSIKQKLNTRISTNSEVVGSDEMYTMIIRKKYLRKHED